MTSFRAARWLHGVRIRKTFKSKDEAANEKASLEMNGLQAASGLRATATRSNNEQIREAEAAFRPLRFSINDLKGRFITLHEWRRLDCGFGFFDERIPNWGAGAGGAALGVG
jgi:hypothetical protein